MLLARQENIEVIGEGGDGAEAVRLAQEHVPDVILLDLLLPDMNGIDVIRQIKTLGLPCAIVILTSSVQPFQIHEAVQAGACGYVVKAIRASELIDAIRRAAMGLRTLGPLAADALMDSLTWKDQLTELTPRELDVLRALACGQSNAKIAQSLGISEATVRSHIANVLSKLHLRDRSQVVSFALKRGLVSLDEIE